MIPYRRNFRKSASTIPNKITRESLISPDVVKVAISKETMFDVSEDGGSIVEIPIPESIKAAGVIPEGYAIDYCYDPATAICALAKINITTIEQLPDVVFAELKQIMNGPDNVTIAPSYVVEGKREAVENSLMRMEIEDAAPAKETSH